MSRERRRASFRATALTAAALKLGSCGADGWSDGDKALVATFCEGRPSNEVSYCVQMMAFIEAETDCSANEALTGWTSILDGEIAGRRSGLSCFDEADG